VPPRKWQLAAFWRLLATLRGQMPPLTLVGRHDAADPELAPEDLWAPGGEQRFRALVPTLSDSGWAQPVQPESVYSVVPAGAPENAAPADEGQVAEARALLFEPDPVRDEGPAPRGRPGRPRGRGRGGLRGGRRWQRGGRGRRGRGGHRGRGLLALEDGPAESAAEGEGAESELAEAEGESESERWSDELASPEAEALAGVLAESPRAAQQRRLQEEWEIFGDISSSDETAAAGALAPAGHAATGASSSAGRAARPLPGYVPDADVMSDEEALARAGLLPRRPSPPRKRRRIISED
jgi:hypothetical protein